MGVIMQQFGKRPRTCLIRRHGPPFQNKGGGGTIEVIYIVVVMCVKHPSHPVSYFDIDWWFLNDVSNKILIQLRLFCQAGWKTRFRDFSILRSE